MSGKRAKPDRFTKLFRELKEARMAATGRDYITVREHVHIWDEVFRYIAAHPPAKPGRAPR